MDANLVETVDSLFKKDNWRGVLNLNVSTEKEIIASKLLWVWPSEENLNFIGRIVKEFNLKGVTSIGCGCGLFEWLLQKCTNLLVVGYEVNREWWTSKYSCPKFIPLKYPKQPPESSCLSEDHALMFCYFNNGTAFDEYVDVYRGNLIFIIGPGEGRLTHTNPEPFKPNFKSSWGLYAFQEVRDTRDFIAVYARM